MIRRMLSLVLACLLVACSGGGSPSSNTGGGSTPTPPAPPPPQPTTLNYTPVVMDAGPAALQVGAKGYSAFNTPFVTITICAPGSTTNCQTVDHVILDTGSVGVRLIGQALTPALLSALPSEMDAQKNPVGECYQYVNSYVFGSVKQVDFSIAGEKVANMPVNVIGDTGVFAAVPSGCSSGGGTDVKTVQDFGANGIVGVGTTATDCGAYCALGQSAAAIYYDCPSTGCSSTIPRAANASAPFEQLPNPVAAFPTDNNGTIITLGSVPAAGAPSLTGTVYFGIGTQSNNALGGQTVLPVTTSSSPSGPGVLTAQYKGKSLSQSFLDSGSNDYYFIDTTLPVCTQSALSAFYCPTAATALSVSLVATDGTVANAGFTLLNPNNTAGTSLVAPGLGVNPTLVKPPLPFANSFDFGIPFFFGRSVYTAIEGRNAGGRVGPYFAY